MPGKAIRVSQSQKAGLIFPVARFHRKLKKLKTVKRISKGAAVYMSAILEYLTAEIIELSGNVCRDNRNARITPRHFSLAIHLDEELNNLLKKVTIPGGGVLPNIHKDLFPKIDQKDLKNQASKSNSIPKKKVEIVAIGRPVTIDFIKNQKNKNTTLLNERTLNKGQKLTVLQASITDVVADAIVHPTSETFHLSGQVGSAILQKGGAEMQSIVNELYKNFHRLPKCQVAISDASKQMLCKKVIHVNSPSWNFSNQAQNIDDLKQVVENILTLAETHKLETIALPSISSGGNGYPKQVAAETILRAINAHFKELDKNKTISQSSIKQVIFVLYDKESVDVYTSELGKLNI